MLHQLLYFCSTCGFHAVQKWQQARAANKVALETTNQTQIADFASWRRQQLTQLQPEDG